MSRVLTVRLAFGIVIFSFLCSLFIAAIFSALDPSALSGSNLGISSYIALFVAQIILVLPSALFTDFPPASALVAFVFDPPRVLYTVFLVVALSYPDLRMV